MTFGSWGPGGAAFIGPDSGYQEVVAAAGRGHDRGGISSFDLLFATLGAAAAVELVIALGASPGQMQTAARAASPAGPPMPGLTDDAKAVIEAAINQALAAGRGPNVRDLLLALASAECPAREVLAAFGINAERLTGLLGDST